MKVNITTLTNSFILNDIQYQKGALSINTDALPIVQIGTFKTKLSDITADGQTFANAQAFQDWASGSKMFASQGGGGGGGNVPSGTEKQVVGYDAGGNPAAVSLGLKQLSDITGIPPFSNGLVALTAINQSTGAAFKSIIELSTDTPKSGTVPTYVSGGRLKVADATDVGDSVNKGQLDRLDYRLGANYMIVKSGANTVATPRFNSGLPTITNTNSASVFQQAVNAISTGLGGKIVFDGDFTFTDTVTITGFDGQFDPRVQISIEGLGYQSRITQNTAGKSIFLYKNKVSAILRNMYLVVGNSGASAIVGDDTGTSPSFGEISIYEGIIENVKVQHSGTAEAVLLKNFFNLQVSHLDVISTTQDAIVLKGTSTNGQNYGNSNFSFVHATGSNTVGKSSISIISDVPNHPINLLTFSNLSIGFGNIGLYMRGATSCTFLLADIEYTPRNIVMANGVAGVNTGNNKFVNSYLYTNVGGTAIECASNSFGNDFNGRIESDDATLTVINDTQQFQAANSYNIVAGYGLGANPTINITSQAFTPFMMRKVFDNLTVMRGPYIVPDLTAVTQNIKPSTGNTRDLGDASNFFANVYAQNLRGNFLLSRSADLQLSTNSTGSGIEFSRNNTGAKDGKFQGTTGELSLGGLTPQAGSQLSVNSTTRYSLPYPRMTNTQKGTLTNLVAGASVYVTDGTATDGSTGVLQVYNGTAWKNAW